MKRTLMLIVLSLIPLSIVAATGKLPREVRDMLQRALVNEREAAARYDVFARKADEEGYRGAAALFRAQAEAERTHEKRLAAVLVSRDEAVPPEKALSPSAGTTRENLQTASSLEQTERDGMYREAIETCKLHSEADVAKVFDQTRDSEVEHANLCAGALRGLESMKSAKTFYVCGKCGYTTDVSLPFCPACQHKVAPAAVE